MSIAGVVYTVVVSLCAAELIRGLAAARRTWSPHRTRPPLDAEHGVYVRGTLEAAFLSGGPARAADALIAGLHEDGRLVVAGPGVVGIPRPTARNAGEQAVIDAYAAGPSGALHGLRTAVMRSLPVQETGEALAGRGLVVRPGRQDKWRRRAGVQVLLSVFGFVVAGMLTVAQYAGDSAATGSADSVGDGIAMLLPAGIFGVVSGLICLSVSSKQLTLAGQYALREYVGSAGHLTGAAHLVATRGLAAAHPDLRAQLVAAARVRVRVPAVTAAGTHPAPYQGTNAGSGSSGTPTWCGSGGGGGGGGSTCSGGAGSACSGGGGSSCGGGGGSSCGGGGGSSCGGGGGSSCGGGGGGSSCGGGGSSCGGGS